MHAKNQANQLIREHSPYLLQHAYNPVNWYPWGEEALEKARKEQKLLIISVGYAACHWCHVMERESFEDQEVADFMNEHFVCIKVDREERPDIDDIYMNACHLTKGGNCGWPLNAFALPDGRPFWAGTYFPKANWLNILGQISTYHQNEPERIEHAANEIMKGIRQMNIMDMPVGKKPVTPEILKAACAKMLENQDEILGGRQGQPKFPMPIIYQYFLKCHHYFGDVNAMTAVKTILDNMMNGGIYDQLGGGFARYSVDKYWFAPHFEKMLYDNAQLVSLYADTFRITQNQSYAKVIRETLNFTEREMLSQEGGFYSAIDADSEGVEGLFYIWKADEIRTVLNDPGEIGLFFDYFGIEEEGNWENGYNILHLKAENQDLEKKYELTTVECSQKIENLKKQLFAERNTRIRPHTDNKVLTSWNGLMIKAYSDAYKALSDQGYKEKAIQTAEFILKNAMKEDGQLFRSFGKKQINGFLDDYALLIAGLISVYEICFEEKWIFTAKKLADFALEHFYDRETGMLFYTSDLDPPLVVRNSEMTDNVIPGASSVMAMNLFLLGKYFREPDFISFADGQMEKVLDPISRFDPSYHSNWLQLGLYLSKEPIEISIVGQNATDLAFKLMQNYLPDVVLSGTSGQSDLPVLADKTNDSDQTRIYICQGNLCFAPVYTIEDALQMVKKSNNEPVK